MDLDFEKLFKISTSALTINRSHPRLKKDIKWFLEAVFMYSFFILVFCLVLYNILYHDLKLNNFSQTCKNGVLSVVYFVVTFQYGVLLYHQKKILKLISFVNDDYKILLNLNSNEQMIIKNYINKGIYVCKQWLFIALIAPNLFVIKNIYLMVYYYCKNEFRLLPLYDLVYPAIVEENKNNILVYLLTYILLLNYGYYAAVMYIAYVPLGPILMLHVCGQLEIVKTRIDRLSKEVDNDVIEKKLKNIIKQLQYIYSFVNDIIDVFRIAYDLTMKATTIILPITVYEVIEALHRGEFSLEFITFIFGGILISSSPCYYSQLLMEKGEDVRIALYSCGWELYYDRRTRTTIQILLLYALRPIAIRTVFSTLCLEALTDLFHQSYAIFNFMNAVWK